MTEEDERILDRVWDRIAQEDEEKEKKDTNG